MRTEIKAIIASVVVIAVCLAAIGGVTYSWFSDSEQSEIDVTAGTIEMDVTFGDVTVSSYGGEPIPVSGETTTDLGGTVSYSVGGTGSESSITITFVNAAPGDSLSFNVSGSLRNTIDVIYTETCTITEVGTPSGLPSPFTVDGLRSGSVLIPASADGTDIYPEASPQTVTVEMNQSAGNEYQGKQYSIVIAFEAYQANAPVSDSVTTTVATGDNNVSVYPPSDGSYGESVSSSISFTSASGGDEITVSAVDPADIDLSDYSVTGDLAFIAGIDVTSANSDSALDSVETVVTFVVKGDYSESSGKSITVLHDGEKFTPSGIEITYSPADDTTTISFTTTDGFSPYILMTESAASIDGVGYLLVEDAVRAAGNSETVVLTSDSKILSMMTIGSGRNVTVDMNGHELNSGIGTVFYVNGGTLTIGGDEGEDSAITATGSPLRVINGGTATVNNMTFTIDDSIYVGASVSTYTYTDKLTMNNVTVNSTYGCLCGFKNCNITINGGEYNDTIGGGFLTNGTAGLGGQKWTVSNAEFNISCDEDGVIAVGIQCHNAGTWTISGCTFNMDNGVALSVRGGNVTVSGCEYNYTNTASASSTGKLQFTDVDVDLSTPYAIATWYSVGSYGCDDYSSLTVDGTSQEVTADKTVRYVDFGTTA